MPSMALNLMSNKKEHIHGDSIYASPFFDNDFWDEEFSKSMHVRKPTFTNKDLNTKK